MDKNWVVASVVAAVAMFVVNLILGMVGVEIISATMAAEFTAQGIVGHLFAGSVLALVLGWKGTGDAADGAKAGATVGVLMGLAGMDLTGMGVVGAVLTGILVYGISGAAVAMAPTGGGDA